MKRNYLRNNLLFFQLIKNLKPRQKQLINSCCVVLAAMITIVTIPILAGHASGENNISDCDIATKSDIANATESSECNTKSICSVKTIEPKRTQTSATEQGITYSIEDSVLTISGTGSVTVKNINHLFPQTDVANIRTVTINEGITDIADYSFQYFEQITSINLPESLTSIGKGAFHSCTGLTSITLPAQISEISEAAFLNCSSLNSIAFNGNITSIGFVAFSECTSLNSFTVPSTISNIGSRVFENCTNLKTVVFECSSLTHTDLKNLISESTEKVVLPCNFKIDGHTPGSGELEWYIGSTVTTIESSHKWDEGSILSSAATCLDQGEIQYTCQFDSTHTKKEYFTGNHSFTHHEAADATCTENGNSEHWKCDVCGKCFSNADGETEITEASTVIPAHHTLSKVNAIAETCTENGNNEHWKCDVCGKCFSDADAQTEITEASTVISSLGHDWSEWIVIKKPTASEDGEAQRACNRDDSHTETRCFNFVFTDSDTTWTTNSDDGLSLTVKDNPDNFEPFDLFKGAFVDGTELEENQYTTKRGSLILALMSEYLQTLSVGTHTLRIDFEIGGTVVSVKKTFTIVKSGGVPSPDTGESIGLTAICMAIMLLAAYFMVYSFHRKKEENSQTYEVK